MLINLVLGLIALFLVLGDRLYMHFNSGGTGLLHYVDIVIPLMAGAIVVFGRKSITPRFASSRNLQCALPYLVIGMFLPILGVLGGTYPWRTLMTLVVSARALCMIAIGIWLAKQPPHTRTLMKRCVMVCIVSQGLLSIAQFITYQGLASSPILSWISAWDVQSMTDHKDTYLITARSTGAFISPNNLGAWSLVGIWFSITVLTGIPGLACTALSLLTLLLSESRGSLFGFLVALALTPVFAARMKRSVWITLAATITLTLGLGMLALSRGGAFQNEELQSTAMQDRLESGFAVFSGGAEADANAQGRLEVWISSMPFFLDHPLGTWGMPQFLLNDSVDSEYLAALLQGSVPYVIALFLALYGGIRVTSDPSLRAFLALSVVSLAVNGISAAPFQGNSIGLYWLIFGYAAVPVHANAWLPRQSVTLAADLDHSLLQPGT